MVNYPIRTNTWNHCGRELAREDILSGTEVATDKTLSRASALSRVQRRPERRINANIDSRLLRQD
jgi:hypothetical protein